MKSCWLTLDLANAPADRIVTTGVVRAFNVLKTHFTPCWIGYSLDGVDRPNLTRAGHGQYQGHPLWVGEEVTTDVLTRFDPTGDDLIGQLSDELTRSGARSIRLSARGALLHRAPGTDAARWYGHWRVPRGLIVLCTVDFNWDEFTTELQIKFSNGGYPLTASRLGIDAVEDGDAAVAAENRASLAGTLRALPTTLGVSGEGWSDGGDYHRWYPDDAVEIRDRWIPALRSR